jgi:ABC-type taurine transport system substrate-binding protein
VTAYYKGNPLFSDAEIKDWHKVIGEQKQAKQTASAPQFSSPADVHAAVASGKLKSGDSFTDPSGKTRYVP